MMTDVNQKIEKHKNFVKKVVWMSHRKSVGILKEYITCLTLLTQPVITKKHSLLIDTWG
jgi:hypothetical protein